MAENNMDVLTVNRTYKSRIFAMLFSDRNELLKLYILKAVMLNINKGHNRKLMETCRTLHDYAEYTSRVREYAAKMPLDEAVERAITECISEGILADFLRKNRAEAKKVSIYEYDEERHMRQTREEGVEEGYANGLPQGIEQTAVNLIKTRLLTDEQIKEVTGLSQSQIDTLRKNENTQ